MNQNLRCALWCPRSQIYEHISGILVCGDDADDFILHFHHAHRLRDVIVELDVSGRNSWRCIHITGKKNRSRSEWGMSVCCSMDQNWPKVVDIYSNPHSYSRYVKLWLPSMRTLAVTMQYYSVRTERTGLSKTAHARCIAGMTQVSMLPISRHFYPKCKNITGPKMWRN